MGSESESPWKRLGRLLGDRRIEIAARYKNKNLFAEEREINRRMVWSIESGVRGNYEKDTLRDIERAYMLAPGSIGRTVDGGDLEPAAGPPVSLAPLRSVSPVPGTALPVPQGISGEILADLVARYPDSDVVQSIAAQHSEDAGIRIVQMLRILKDPELDREILARLMSRSVSLSEEKARAVQAIGSQRGKRELMRVTEILEFLGWRPPNMEAESGTAGLPRAPAELILKKFLALS